MGGEYLEVSDFILIDDSLSISVEDIEFLLEEGDCYEEEETPQPNRRRDRRGSACTYLEEDPVTLRNLSEKSLQVFVEWPDYDLENIVLESVLLQGKIPSYSEPEIEGDRLVSDALLLEFIQDYRPITDDVSSGYTIEFDLIDGKHVVLNGDIEILVYPGDLNFDGIENVEDITFLVDYLFLSGQACLLEEMMDLTHDGVVDEEDLRALVEIVY